MPPWIQRLTARLPIVLSVAFGALVLARIAPAFSARLQADDYCDTSKIQTLGFWTTQIDEYRGWTGKFTYTAVTSVISTGGGAMALPVLEVVLGTGGLAWFIKRLRPTLPVLVLALPASLITVALAIGLQPARAQSLYWVSGSVPYSLALACAPVLAALLLAPGGARHAVLAGLLAFGMSGLSETWASAQCVGLLILLYVASRARAPTMLLRRHVAAALAGSLGGAALVALAPGNAIRAVAFQAPEQGLGVGARRIVPYFSFYMAGAWTAHWQLLLAAAAAGVLLGMHHRAALRVVRPARAVAGVLVCGLLLTVAAIMPAMILGIVPPDRSLAVPAGLQAASVVAAAVIAGAGGRRRVPRLAGRPGMRLTMGAVGCAVIALGVAQSLAQATTQARQLHAVAIQLDAREQAIQTAAHSGDRTVTLPLIDGLQTDDITADPTFWVNSCIAAATGVTVRADLK